MENIKISEVRNSYRVNMHWVGGILLNVERNVSYETIFETKDKPVLHEAPFVRNLKRVSNLFQFSKSFLGFA